MLDGADARFLHQPLCHGTTARDMLVDGAFEPGDFEGCPFGIGMPEIAHLVPLRGVSAVAFCDDNLFDLEAVERIWFRG